MRRRSAVALLEVTRSLRDLGAASTSAQRCRFGPIVVRFATEGQRDRFLGDSLLEVILKTPT